MLKWTCMKIPHPLTQSPDISGSVQEPWYTGADIPVLASDYRELRK